MNLSYTIKHFALIAAFCCIAIGYSATRTWTGNTNTSWSTNTNWVSNTAPGTGDTVVINAGSANYPSLTGSITISRLRLNGGSLTLGNNNLTLSRSSFITGGTLSSGSGTIDITGSLTVSGGTFSKTSGTIDISVDLNLSGGIFSKGSGTLKIDNDMNMTGGTFNANSGNIDVENNISMSAGTFNGGTASIGKVSFAVFGTNNITISGGTLNATTITVIRGDNLILTGGTINLAGDKLTLDDDLTLDGALLNISGANLSVPEDFFMISGTLDLNGFAMTVIAEFEYNGGTFTDPASQLNTKDFTLDGSGTFTLNFNLNISRNLAFLNGKLKTSPSNLLIFGSGTNLITGADNAKHVVGPVRKLMNSGGVSAFTFPIGNGIVYAPIGISNFQQLRSEDYFTAQYDNEYAPYNHASKDVSLDHISSAEYWILDRGASSGTPTTDAAVTLSYNETNRSGVVNNSNQLVVAKWDGSAWKNLGASNFATVSPSNDLNVAGTFRTASVVTDFSPFTIGSTSGLSALPVSLLSFTATGAGSQVNIDWSTTSEINNDFFSVQKSLDGKTWSVIGIVNAVENPDQVNYYSLVDRTPVKGVQYYRLIQTDIKGLSTTSQVVAVSFTGNNLPAIVSLSPNPVKNMVSISLSENSANTSIAVYNSMGVKVMERGDLSGSSYWMDFSSLPNGVYLVEIRHENGVSISRMIKN